MNILLEKTKYKKQNHRGKMGLIMMVLSAIFLISCVQGTSENTNSNLSTSAINDEESIVTNVITDSSNENSSENNVDDKESKFNSDIENESSNLDSELSDNIKALFMKANEGDADAQNTLAYYYFNGYGVEQDYDKSLNWSKKSAESGNLASMFNVGYHYYHGFSGEVNYELAFEWYEKAADRMFPKALNALGHMYYTGLGTEKNIELAYDYTLQSAGLLHNYSLSNIGIMIDELELDQDSNMWLRFASKNYMIPSGSNNLLYDRLNDGEDVIKVDYLLEAENIPKDLIQDILYKYYSGTLYEYLEKSSLQYKNFDLEGLNIEENTRSMMEYRRWYDSSYLVDVDSDGIEELIVYQLDGTIGISSFKILKKNDGKFTADGNFMRTNLMHGINGFINYKDDKYFIIGNIDIGNRSIFSVSIYSFEGGMLADSVEIKTVEKDINVIKTYQVDVKYDELIDNVEARINDMFVIKYNSLLYENVNESMIIDIDINNDGDSEHYEYHAMFYGTINNPLSLDIKEELSTEEDLATIEQVLRFNDLTVPIGLEVFTINGENYIGVLSYEIGTNNHCFTTFLIENEEYTLISNHLIAYNEEFIVSDENPFF
ncbi:tetratricopeptide repeat protein [Vallitalea okinawensis]|uniref:tetratricopeptide repeat protein n=1 Tax=Vallitalea okinawensis TaxID=2078660 RepID=UPI000CFBB0EC|nr:tetratricopeptide repeat protein [Vallitalea okinawensis]